MDAPLFNILVLFLAIGYVFMMSCPLNERMWRIREHYLNCNISERYHCLYILDKAEEFCAVPVNIKDKKCLVNKTLNSFENCSAVGCPKERYSSNGIFRYPKCPNYAVRMATTPSASSLEVSQENVTFAITTIVPKSETTSYQGKIKSKIDTQLYGLIGGGMLTLFLLNAICIIAYQRRNKRIQQPITTQNQTTNNASPFYDDSWEVNSPMFSEVMRGAIEDSAIYNETCEVYNSSKDEINGHNLHNSTVYDECQSVYMYNRLDREMGTIDDILSETDF